MLRVVWIYGLVAFGCLAASRTPITLSEFTSLTENQRVFIEFVRPPESIDEIREIAEKAEERAKRGLRRIRQQSMEQVSFTRTVLAYDVLMHHLSKAMSRINLICWLGRGTPLEEPARKYWLQLAHLYDEVTLDEDLYHRFLAVQQRGGLQDTQKRLVEVILSNFQIPARKMKAIVDSSEVSGLNIALAKQVTEFEAGIAEQSTIRLTAEDLDGVDPQWLAQQAFDGSHYELDGADWSTYDQVIRFAKQSKTRKKIWMAHYGGAADRNARLIDIIAATRARLAHRLGHGSWARYVTQDMSLQAPSVIQQLSYVRRSTERPFLAEKREMAKLLGHRPQIWDVLYAKEMKRASSGFSDAALRGYFTLENVLEGLFRYSEDFFNLTIRPLSGVEPWPQARVFVVSDRTTARVLGAFALDLQARENKMPGFFADTLRSVIPFKTSTERPFVYLHASFGSGDPDYLMSMEEVWTLFHEFGHVLHSVLQEDTYFHLGPDGNFDLVELFSTFMERLAWEPEILRTLGVPEQALMHLSASRELFAVHQLRQMLAQSVLDLRLHSSRPGRAERVEQGVFSDYYYPLPKGMSFSGSFEHLGGYDASYWTYLWAQTLADHLVFQLKESPHGVFDKDFGTWMRRNLFSRGSADTSRALIERALGKLPPLCSTLIGNAAAN